MAQTFLTAAMGGAANDGSGSKIRPGGLLIAADLAELYTLVAALTAASVTAAGIVRAAEDGALGTIGQVIGFSAPFVGSYTIIISDPNGLGISITAQDSDGFTIDSGSAGYFSYVAVVNV